MSKPLQARKDTLAAAHEWHRDVFREYGSICWLHKAQNPQSKTRATDAAHILARSHIGAKLAYVSVRLGRPACRECHEKQERGEIRFPLVDRIDATLAHNEVAKSKLMVPDE
jgi:hypothetical protein